MYIPAPPIVCAEPVAIYILVMSEIRTQQEDRPRRQGAAGVGNIVIPRRISKRELEKEVCQILSNKARF